MLKMSKSRMYAYLISHNREDIKTHTYIGCTGNFSKRLLQHNGVLPGGPRMTKRAAGHWKPIIILELPADRTFDSKALKREWKQSSRGLESRIRKAFTLALKHNLKIYISKINTSNNKVLLFLNKKWKDNKINLSESEWNRLVN